MRFSRTGIGVQMINGKSYISFPPNSRKKRNDKIFHGTLSNKFHKQLLKKQIRRNTNT
ncbi:hypothetical protein MBCUT_03360 [Methanobrevibacter cuticularis]|uniref:Uncharacterized protein n=1 Tax=Methanobrevibacter cuticularis TaxID=47311 RepID=A0A166F0H8_9EURY|nr:hypothetical protein MBCUT_03360 [Methanobrevibacter cuticularis]